MTIRLSAAVMHHPSRPVPDGLADELDASVIPDPDPTGPVWPWRTARLAWMAAPRSASHHLVVQDDALVCPGFHAAAVSAIAARPGVAVAFYVGDRHPGGYQLLARAALCHAWTPLPAGHFLPTVCLALPAAAARDAAAYGDTIQGQHQGRDDEILGAYRTHAQLGAYATIPCLAQHDTSIPSVAGNTAHGHRISICYIGLHDPLRIDWQAA